MAKKAFEWDDLRYVLAIARCGGLGAAARSLGVNHSSVYRRLAALEQRLSVRLFERNRSGYHLTTQGETLADSAKRIEAEALAAERQVRGADLKLSGTIRISTSELIGFHLLPPLLRELGSLYPDVDIELSVDNRLVDLTRRDADVVVRATHKPPEHLIGRRISKMASCGYAHSAYLDRIGRNLALEEYEWLGFDETLARVPQAHWLQEHFPHGRFRYRFDMIEALHQYARAGVGAAFMPCFVGDRESDLERLTPPETFGEYGIWVLTHPDLRRSARIRAFMQDIGSMIATHGALLLGRRPARRAGKSDGARSSIAS